MTIPSGAPKVSKMRLQQHQKELHCITTCALRSQEKGKLRVACTDSSGGCSISLFDSSVGGQEPSRNAKRRRLEDVDKGKGERKQVVSRHTGERDKCKSLTFASTWNLKLQLDGLKESGYHGIALNPSDDKQSCVVSHWQQALTVFDGDKQVSKFGCLFLPTQVQFVPERSADSSKHGGGGNIVVLTESNYVSVYDIRTSKGCQKRLAVGNGDSLGLALVGDNMIASGGTDRTLFYFDMRKWSTLARLQNITKYEIIGLRPSFLHRNAVYVASLDHEILLATCGLGKGKERVGSHLTRQGLRGDSRWIGIDTTPTAASSGEGHGVGGENFIGVTDTGRFYCIENSQRMLRTSNDKST